MFYLADNMNTCIQSNYNARQLTAEAYEDSRIKMHTSVNWTRHKGN